MRRICFVTCRTWPEISESDRLAQRALEARGATVEARAWNAPAADWSGFDAIVLRSNWDYHFEPDAFLGWLDRLERAGARIWNPARSAGRSSTACDRPGFEYNITAMDASTVARWRTLALVLLGAFLGMSFVVYTVGLLPGDVPLHREILKGRGSWLHATARWADYGGKWIFLAPAFLLLLACSRAARRHWWLWCALMPVGGAVEQIFKFVVGRPRPRGVNWGFPSGHVTAAATFAVVLLYVVSRERVSPAARAVFLGLAIALVGAVGFARVILNAHWPTDVLGGVLLGAGCAAAGAWWDARHPESAEPARPGVANAIRIGG